MIREADDIYLKFGADEKVYGIEDYEAIENIRAKAIRANLKLIECPIRHLGTEEGYKIYTRLQNHLLEQGVEYPVYDHGEEYPGGRRRGKRCRERDKGETYYASEDRSRNRTGKDRSGFLISVKSTILRLETVPWMWACVWKCAMRL